MRDDAPPPWLPEGSVVSVTGRGEFFVRRHVHPDPSAPSVLLLHGWTASSDLQFMGAYRELAEVCSFVGLDHRGHGRGVRSLTPFTLEDVADDAAAVVRELGVGPVIAIGYSMGGPIAMHVTRRHADIVSGLIVQATALEWSATRRERLTWWLLPVVGTFIRSRTQPHLLRKAVARMLDDDADLARHRDWVVAETMRSDPRVVLEAGKALRHHDARTWAGQLGVPAGALISTRDRLVKPRKQRALAAALGADVVEVAMDHLGALEQPDDFAAATIELIGRVAAASR